MASFTVKALSRCAGGHHIRLQISGDVSATVELSRDEIDGPMTPDDKRRLLVSLLRVHFEGKTPAQAWTELSTPAGVAFVI